MTAARRRSANKPATPLGVTAPARPIKGIAELTDAELARRLDKLRPVARTPAPAGRSKARSGPNSEIAVETQEGALQRLGADLSPIAQPTPETLLSESQDSNLGHSLVPASSDPLADAEAADRAQLSVEMLGCLSRTFPDQFEQAALAAANRYIGIGTRDPIEQMLATQMMALHGATMDCARRANAPGQHPDVRREELHLASKTSRAFASLVETFDKRRRGGKQKVTVEHVHVHSGGQAIVGNVTGGAHRGRREK
jgi:hypothetical protein